MPQSEHFRFFQISHFLQSLCPVKPDHYQVTPYETWYTRDADQRGGISLVYGLLLTNSPPRLPHMVDWDTDLGEKRDTEVWQSCFLRSYRGIWNVALIEGNLKVLICWYLVTTRLAKMYPSVSPLCF